MTTDYKDTLNLPKTGFAMKANLANREPKMLEFWQKENVYGKLREQRAGKEQFILHDGPPYANGHLHLGHALNKTLKDFIVKSKSMAGYDAPYVPGWDCHGLPIELNVEKKLGKADVNLSAQTFREKCREYATSQVDIQREEFKRFGVMADWENPYVTMDFKYEANIIRALGKIVEKGALHQGFKPVHWCMNCQSALAEAEVEYEDKHSPAIDVKFLVVDDADILNKLQHSPTGAGIGEIIVPIWTTTPWTLPANEAVAVNPNLDYSLVQCHSNGHAQRILLAESLIKDVMVKYGIEEYRVVAYGQGKDLAGLQLQHPFYDKRVPIVCGDHVTVDAGTGCVHTAPGHGPDDYQIGIKNNLPINNPVNSRGVFKDDTELFAGQHITKANDLIIEQIKANGNMLYMESIQHSYPHCWRHKTPVIFRATPQWFISLDNTELRQKALAANEKVNWIPEWGLARMAGMVENRPDWCISRQRNWGTPITLFIHKDTNELHPATIELIEEVAKRVEEKGIDAWFDLEPQDLIKEDADNYIKVTDTLDVWFDSGVSHYCVLEQRPDLSFPAQVYLEGSDQHRGWFQSSLLSSILINDAAPFETVITHGFTVDAKGRKMSKSLGNTVAPEKIMNTLGADIMRLWVAATDYRAELTISDEIMKRMSEAYRRIRNTARFLLSNLFDFDPAQHQVKTSELLALDAWAIEQTKSLQQEIITAYDKFNFHQIYQKIQNFCSMTMGSFYLDIIKDRQYTTATNSIARRSCQTAMFHIIEALVRWLAPILSFTAEEIWQHMPGEREKSIFYSTWYDGFPADLSQAQTLNAKFWEDAIAVRDEVNKVLEAKRAEGIIGSGLAAEVTLFCEPELKQSLLQVDKELRFLLITSEAECLAITDKANGAVATDRADLFIDVKASEHAKCARCWHRRADVGSVNEHPEICARCAENISGEGERRLYA